MPSRHTAAVGRHCVFNRLPLARELLATVAVNPRRALSWLAVLALVYTGQARDSASASEEPESYNVNSRYTVEDVVFSGAGDPAVSSSLAEGIHRLIGQKLNLPALNRLCRQIGSEIRARHVSFHLVRGDRPESVRVVFDIERNPSHFDFNLPRVAYNSELGWTAEGTATATFGSSVLSITAFRDAEDSIANVNGFRAGYQLNGLASGLVRVAVNFDEFGNTYSPAAFQAAGPGEPGLIRSSWDVLPTVSLLVAGPVTITAGFEIEQIHPLALDARTETVNSFVHTLRFQRKWSGTDGSLQEMDAGYSLQAAARSFGSDFGFAKQQFDARYAWRRGRTLVEASMLAGMIAGNAPLLDRFVLGDSTMLRGWSRLDIDPLGGDRAAEASFTYGYRAARVFYDTGSVWLHGEAPELRQSLGAGVEKDRLLVAVAFPLRQGRLDPVLIAGMNF